MKRIMEGKSSNYTDQLLFWLYLVFFISIIFSFRAITSISIFLIAVAGIARNRKVTGQLIGKDVFSFFLIGCCLLYLVQCVSLIYSSNTSEGLRLLQRSSGLVFIPFAVLCSNGFLTIGRRQQLIRYFAFFLCLASVYCLLIAFFKYLSGSSLSVLFYHDLVKPLSQHAIQFSILVLIVIVFLIESEKEKPTGLPAKILIVFFSFFLVLLASKLVICFYLLYLFYFFLSKRSHKTHILVASGLFITVVIVVLSTSNPVGNRFKAIFSGNSELFEQEKFSPGVYFNGLQFRLLQWRFTYKILSQQNAWVQGLSPGDAQSLLDKKYVETNMYTGVPGTEKKGFLGYHTHNQFLQTLLENGFIGLIIFLFICFSLIRIAQKNTGKEVKFFAIMILIYCFTDAPLETQYGLVLFTFFPLFLSMQDKPPLPESSH